MSTVRCWQMTQSSPALGINARVDSGVLAPGLWARFGRYLRPMESGSRFTVQ
jgi:hypothetical protein